MEKKQLTPRKAIQTKTNKKTSSSLKKDKSVEKKPVLENTPPIADSSLGTKKAELHGIARTFSFNGCFIWYVVIPGSFIFLLLVYFLAAWFFGLFTEDNDSIFKLNVAFFGILGATAGWLWKKTQIFTMIGAILGIIIALIIPSYLTSLGPCLIGC